MTTNAEVSASAGSKAASIAWRSLSWSRPAGSGSAGRTSPIGHGVVLASGRFGVTVCGVKWTPSLSGGSVMQPCDPK